MNELRLSINGVSKLYPGSAHPAVDDVSLEVAPGSYPNLSAHYDRMLTRPAVQRTLEAEAAIGYNLPV